jgi:hypothetical protein
VFIRVVLSGPVTDDYTMALLDHDLIVPEGRESLEQEGTVEAHHTAIATASLRVATSPQYESID